MILVRFLDLTVPTQTRGFNDRNFKSTALVRLIAVDQRAGFRYAEALLRQIRNRQALTSLQI